MGGTRNFGVQQGHLPQLRNIDNDAPAPMRQELLAVAYDLLPLCGGVFTEAHLYYGIEQMLGQQAAGKLPIAGGRPRPANRTSVRVARPHCGVKECEERAAATARSAWSPHGAADRAG